MPTELNNTTREAEASKQAEILFKFFVVLSSADILFLRRISLDILNSLKLKYSNGGNEAIIKVTITDAQGMIMSFEEITHKVVYKISIIARRVSSLRLVTDVR